MPSKRLLVLDTNVLMHDPSALFRFQEHDLYLPMVVIEELDKKKKGTSEVARNVRQVSRFLDELISSASNAEICAGLELHATNMHNDNHQEPPKLFLQTETFTQNIATPLPGHNVDNEIINIALGLSKKHPEIQVAIVSKDMNLRIKAAMLGLIAEDYYNDYAIDDLQLLQSGTYQFSDSFWESHQDGLKSWNEAGQAFYQVKGQQISSLPVNTFIYDGNDTNFQGRIRAQNQEPQQTTISLSADYTQDNHSVWGITARNLEQNFAFNLLMDPEIDLVTILGSAGTGKTLLTLAAGLSQVLDSNLYREIIMTRITVPVGDDIGFLPGTEEEKMTPWMGALMDNLEVLTESEFNGDWERSATNDLIRHKIKIRSLNFMRGRTFLNKFIIIDEAQNLTRKQMQTLITRAGPGTKMVCLGNLGQIDTPYLTESTSGLTMVVDKFKNWEHSGHITLARGERSRLADFAAQSLA